MPKDDNFKTFYAISLAWQLGFFIAVPIGGFLLLGYAADRWLNTQPLFLIIGLVVGFAITVYEVIHLIAPVIKDTDKHD